jgi:hypothetical protein
LDRINRRLNKVTKKQFMLLFFAAAIILVLIPLAFTPMLSDDFIYITNNTKWSDLGWRYLHWSGRLVADSFSLILLQLPSIIYKLLKAIIWIGLLLLISFLPSIFNNKYTWRMNNFIIIFLLYWVANPNLGETSLWSVGFANYLLTNFFIVAYFALLFYLKDRPLRIWHYLAIAVLGLLSGNSNENTSIVVILLTLTFLLIENKKHVFLLGLPFTVIGTLSLLLSPGQYARLQHPSFQISREKSLFQRLWDYFSSQWFIDTFSSFAWLFVTFIFIGFIYFFRKQYPQKRNAVYSIIFFFSAIIANAAFGGSYVFPVAIRSLNGSLILFLISIAFISDDIRYTTESFYKKSMSYLTILLCIPFLFSYVYSTKSVFSLHRQFNVREQAILAGKSSNQESIYIPNYYVGKLYNPSDSVNLYHGGLENYYDIKKGSSIVQFNKDFSFDYSNKKLINTEQVSLNESFGNPIKLKAINIFPDARSSDKYSVNLTFDNDLKQVYSANDHVLFIHINWQRDAQATPVMFNADTSLNNQLFVDGKYVFSSPINDIRPQDIKSIDVGIYDTSKKTNPIQVTIDMESTHADKK